MDYEHNYYPAQTGHPPPQQQQQPPQIMQQQHHHISQQQQSGAAAIAPQQQQNQYQQQPPPMQMQPQHHNQHNQNFMGPNGATMAHLNGGPIQPSPMQQQQQQQGPPLVPHYAQQNNHQIPGHSPIGTPHSSGSPHHHPQQQPPPPQILHGPSPQHGGALPPQPHYVQQNHHLQPGQQPQQNVGPQHGANLPHPHPNLPPHHHQQHNINHPLHSNNHQHQSPNTMPPMHPSHQHHHNHGPPLPPPGYMNHHNHNHHHHHNNHNPMHNNHHMYDNRGSPFYQNIPQTEFRIIELNKRLQRRPRLRGPSSPLPNVGSTEESYWWERFAADFFDDDATLMLKIAPDDKPVEYTIGRTLIPRFFKSYFDGGVVDLSIKIKNARETIITTNPQLIMFECDQADIISKYNFKHAATNMPMNIVVHTEGHLNLEFVSNNYDLLQIKSWKFFTHQCHEYIDRSVTSTGVPNAFLTEPVTRHGLTTSTISYLKMCMIMEPMQELMLQHRNTKLDPRSCLKQLLSKYKLKSVDDNKPKRRQKRKTNPNSGANTGGNKKTKGNSAQNNNNNNNINNGNNNINNNNNNSNNNINSMGYNNIDNNSLMSPSTGQMPNISLASQDVMVVGEPSMLGADFGDENERRITRLENNQYDSSLNSNNTNTSNNNNTNNSNNGDNMDHGIVTN